MERGMTKSRADRRPLASDFDWRVRMDGNSSANLAQFDSLFKDGDLQPTRPQGERGRQATNSAAHDRNLKLP
jgi:hypothetical protein